ncbi:hypothetical protein LPUS_05356 [Lasallia pustulata]|uniref:Uncharacterized protein n=1 Tax=Lasallia pustulata TaxID=136370 RepID=A0A1W5CYN1_9LECA|nr:hypothetical protein LPUS_05356 [Lasallia pustulata]
MRPESFISLPLTPPPTGEKTTSSVSRIIEEIRNRQKGRSLMSIPWARYTLDLKGYQDLLQQLQSEESLWGFAQDKLRYDYFSSASRLVLRTPGFLHEQFIAIVVKEIQTQLDSIEGASAAFAKKIIPSGSASIKFADQGYCKHDPDTQFRHSKARYPSVVIEVSHSQKRKDLERLADDYILGSESEIRVVVGLDIEYKMNKKATLSVWQPSIVINEAGEKELITQKIITNEVFRDSNGNPNTSRTEGLQLRLQDFTTIALAEPEAGLCGSIAISAKTLCLFLEYAEDQVSIVKQQTDVVTSAKPWVRKRRREITPPEELSHED